MPPLPLCVKSAFLAGLLGVAMNVIAAENARAQPFAPQPFGALKDSVPSLTTIGTASIEVVPNIATISLGVETERPTAAEAASENARAAQAIVGEIKAQGIDARDVKTVSVTLAPVYDEARDANGRVTKRTLRGYVARNDLNVRVRQVEKAGALARLWIEERRQ